jgi:two-component system, LytTR family, sensor kinase
MKKAFVIILHIGYWLMYLLLLSVILAIANIQLRKPLSLSNLTSLFPLIILCVVPNLISFYSSYLFLFPKFLFRKKILSLIIFGSLICLISALSGSFLSILFFGLQQPVFANSREFSSLLATLFLIAGVHGVIALVIRGFITWYDEIKLKEELYKKNYEMELALIKSQINPHFLFNTINNIDVLISRDAARASAYLNKLSDIMRYMVYETKTEKISLARELSYIEKYLELQKISTSNPNYVNFELEGNPNDFLIAPMILFPFIENAFKHTENKKKFNSIKIKVFIEKDRLVFECENSYQKQFQNKQDFNGVGNELIKRRLVLIYPDSHRLEITDNDGIYKVKLTLYEN